MYRRHGGIRKVARAPATVQSLSLFRNNCQLRPWLGRIGLRLLVEMTAEMAGGGGEVAWVTEAVTKHAIVAEVNNRYVWLLPANSFQHCMRLIAMADRIASRYPIQSCSHLERRSLNLSSWLTLEAVFTHF